MLYSGLAVEVGNGTPDRLESQVALQILPAQQSLSVRWVDASLCSCCGGRELFSSSIRCCVAMGMDSFWSVFASFEESLAGYRLWLYP